MAPREAAVVYENGGYDGEGIDVVGGDQRGTPAPTGAMCGIVDHGVARGDGLENAVLLEIGGWIAKADSVGGGVVFIDQLCRIVDLSVGGNGSR